MTKWEGVVWGESTTGFDRELSQGGKWKMGEFTGRVVKLELNRLGGAGRQYQHPC